MTKFCICVAQNNTYMRRGTEQALTTAYEPPLGCAQLRSRSFGKAEVVPSEELERK
jgi:hypothetical protein